MSGGAAETASREALAMVGGSALPGGVMMRTSTRVGVAVRQDATGEVVTEGFDIHPPRGRWARWPLMRGVVAMRTALKTGAEAFNVSERLRWDDPEIDADWGVTDPVLSGRDQANPRRADLEPQWRPHAALRT